MFALSFQALLAHLIKLGTSWASITVAHQTEAQRHRQVLAPQFEPTQCSFAAHARGPATRELSHGIQVLSALLLRPLLLR